MSNNYSDATGGVGVAVAFSIGILFNTSTLDITYAAPITSTQMMMYIIAFFILSLVFGSSGLVKILYHILVIIQK